jgi:hypothetical protein
MFVLLAADVTAGASRDELGDYPGSPLEKVDSTGVIRWWGVSILFLNAFKGSY